MLTNSNGTLSSSYTSLNFDGFGNPYSFAFADIDGDGDNDLIASGYYNGPYILKNNAGSYSFLQTLSTTQLDGGYDALRTADFDEDGKLVTRSTCLLTVSSILILSFIRRTSR